MSSTRNWGPAVVLLIGCVLLTGVRRQLAMELRAPLNSALPEDVRGWEQQEVTVSEAEAAVVGFTDYAFRVYEAPTPDTAVAGEWASVYLGYYDQQSRGRTIHSPKNCLPGAGWEALSSTPLDVEIDGAPVTVNRYLLQNGDAQALVLYWYQGRGRVAHNEYLVKWDLLRDAMLSRRTEEALVRIVVPVLDSEEDSLELALSVARRVKPALDQALPAA